MEEVIVQLLQGVLWLLSHSPSPLLKSPADACAVSLETASSRKCGLPSAGQGRWVGVRDFFSLCGTQYVLLQSEVNDHRSRHPGSDSWWCQHVVSGGASCNARDGAYRQDFCMAWHGMLASRLCSSGIQLSMVLTEDIFEQGFHAGSRFLCDWCCWVWPSVVRRYMNG
jgi:hypothetical protein